MKIKRIELYNIGPYVEKNIFDFDISSGKNIVLIGGKNGAGKTTFFKAIKTCLYGCKVWGFDAPGKEYYSIVNSLVNFKMLYSSSAKAYIEIELVFDDGKQVNIYTLRREWAKLKMSLSEFFQIRKNGELILGTEEDDFVNYLLSVIPPDMFNFYFFDGESIAEFFLGAEGNKNFRNAFLKLYNLDTLSIMIDNFARNIKKGGSASNSFNIYTASKLECEKQEAVYNSLLEDVKDIENHIDLSVIKLHSLQENYTKEGGIALDEWKEFSAALLKEETERDNVNRQLKDIANNYLPFILLTEQMNDLLGCLDVEQEHRRNELICQSFDDDTFVASINDYLKVQGVSNINIDALLCFLKSKFQNDETGIVFDFSTSQINRIISQINEKESFPKEKIRELVAQLNASLKRSKKLRERMLASSVDGYETFIAEKDELEKEISRLSIELERKKQEVEAQKNIYEASQNNFLKAKDNYGAILKSKSISDMAERAVAVYSLLEDKLVSRQAKILQDEFLRCFKAMINKEDFIDGITIDKNINIIPYKNIKIYRNQLTNYLQANKEFLDLFGDAKYVIEMNKLEFEQVEYILLPSPIKAPFSQGERQVYIMSIYLALLKTSRKDIPFFIDTPFARIDSNHRTNIVNEFFNKIKNQLFILSTDEEIVGEYRQMIDKNISNVFTLSITDYGRTQIITNQYFGD